MPPARGVNGRVRPRATGRAAPPAPGVLGARSPRPVRPQPRRRSACREFRPRHCAGAAGDGLQRPRCFGSVAARQDRQFGHPGRVGCRGSRPNDSASSSRSWASGRAPGSTLRSSVITTKFFALRAFENIRRGPAGGRLVQLFPPPGSRRRAIGAEASAPRGRWRGQAVRGVKATRRASAFAGLSTRFGEKEGREAPRRG